jgi:hypothetical protein
MTAHSFFSRLFALLASGRTDQVHALSGWRRKSRPQIA